MPGLIADILLTVLAPILLLVGIGVLLRWRLRVDVATLGKLNIYLFVPAFIFQNVATSKLTVGEMGGIFLITVIQVVTLGLIVWGIGRALKISRKTLAAIALAVMFYNSGNYGLPLADLAYPKRNVELPLAQVSGQGTADGAKPQAAGPKDGAAVQTFVMMAMNLLTFTLGMGIAAAAHTGSVGKGFLTLIRLPIIPGLIAGILAQWWVRNGGTLPILITKTTDYIAGGLVAVSLITLGAQLASNPRWPRWKPVGLVLVLRLLIGPIQMAGILYLFHRTGVGVLDVWPWPAELLILTASVPTAVNTLLLTLEIGGDADLTADCVFWTTVFSVVTITGWLVVLRTIGWFG
ncbi:MAG TPA: AEC family transporter [Tepidisphaeraceae bacterium]|nr:AEC family transporter [Tepidisphaeraceae bacterium]